LRWVSKARSFSEDDKRPRSGVEGSPYAIGYFGFAYFTRIQAQLQRRVAIDDVEPKPGATVTAGEYPLARPLFIYSDAKIITEKPQVAVPRSLATFT